MKCYQIIGAIIGNVKKRSIRTSILLTMAVSFFAMFVIIYALFSTAMNSLLSEREIESMREQTDLERNMLASSMDYITNITKEWALLPAVEEYMLGKRDKFSPQYLMSEDVLQLHKLNLFALISSDGSIKTERYYRYNDGTDSKNPTDLSTIYSDFSAACKGNYDRARIENTLSTADMGVDGYVSQNGFVYYLSAYPIISTREESSTMMGILCFGRLIDEEELYGVAQIKNSPFSVVSRAHVKLTEAESAQLDQKGFIIQPNGDSLTSYAILGNALDGPDILVCEKNERHIYAEGQGFIWTFIGLIAFGCFVILFIMMNLMDRTVARPITNLIDEVHELGTQREIKQVSENARSAEVNDLARSINMMMEKIDRDRQLIEKKNESLYYNANYDLLTSLRNRINFESELTGQITIVERQNKPLCVFFMDVDRLKYINDTFGHPFGDKLIKAVAQRLDYRFSRDNLVARMGGDEFAICSHACQNSEQMNQLAEQILSVFSEPFHVGEVAIEITASLGSSLYPYDGIDGVTLIKNAEMAMYNAKSGGKGLHSPYRKDFHKKFQRQVYIESKMRNAIHEGCTEFELYLQPKLEVQSGNIELCEALIRWNTPEGMLSPNEFISIAEDSALIIPLTWWIIDESYRHARLLQDAGYPTVISVNAPPQVIVHEEFPDRLLIAAEKAGVEPCLIDIEITERILLDEPELVLKVFEGLQRNKITISVDDFGTGYSSLSYLDKLSVNRLKIDRSFISSLGNKNDGQSIVLAIIAMAKSLGILLTAEGVETDPQYQFLKNADCDEIQGFVVSKPIPLEAYLSFVASWNFADFEASLAKDITL